MVNNESEVVIFLSSPSDVQAERAIVLDEIQLLPNRDGGDKKRKLRVIRWPEDIAAGAGDYAQSVINQQTYTYDIFVGLIGSRLGSPTPRANSGSEEEFDRAIELEFGGHPLQILLFFSNLPVPLGNLDPYQLMLVRYFKEKANRLGILSHSYNSLEEFRRLFRLSLDRAYENVIAIKGAAYPPTVSTSRTSGSVNEKISIGNIRFMKTMAPQWADYRPIPLAAYRGASIALRGYVQTSSRYFRFGFKYCDVREPIVSPGSIQTQGQNILVHVGKNVDRDSWFLTAYRAGYRLGPNVPLNNIDVLHPVRFSIEIAPVGTVALTMNNSKVYETFFQVDGLSNLILLAWGDEHEFECTLTDLELEIVRDAGGNH